MKILFLSTEFPNQYDSTKATFNLDLLKALATNHDVKVISPIPWTEEISGRFFTKSETTLEDHHLSVTYPRYYFIPKVFRKYYHRFLWWSIQQEISDLEFQPKPDCVLSYWAHPDGSVAVKLARKLGVRSVLMVGGSDVLVLTKDRTRRSAILDALNQADSIITVSEDLKTQMTNLGITPSKINVLRRGVDHTVFFTGAKSHARETLLLPLDQKIGLWVGRFVAVKSVETLIKGMHEITKQFPSFHLYLIGGGPLEKDLINQVRSADLESKVHFVGKCPHEQLGDWYRAADFTVLPSLSEGIPNVLLESLACGTPFVASNVGGIPEISSNSYSRLFKPKDSKALSKQIKTALKNRLKVKEKDRPLSLDQFAESVAQIAKRTSMKKVSAPLSLVSRSS